MMEKRKGMIGQLFSAELMVASSIFLAAIIVFLFVWNTLYNNYIEEQSDNKMQVVLIGVSDAAVMSSGEPSNWEITAGRHANSYGFASSRNMLSSSKLYTMQEYFAANYTDMKEKMGAGGFDLFMDVKDADGNTYYSFGRLADTTNQSISAISVERLALMDDRIVNLRAQLWRIRGRGI